MRIVGICLALLMPMISSAQEVVEVENKAYWMCKHNQEVRTIRVQVSDKGICSTYYSKQGGEKSVGSGKNTESCVTFLNNIKTNLEKSKFSCRDISATRITASVDEAKSTPAPSTPPSENP